jgi:hypothetical protein
MRFRTSLSDESHREGRILRKVRNEPVFFSRRP